jgi:hypothetical protein
MANYEEFVDPNSAIARIIAQMQGAATRSNPDLVDQQRLQTDLRPGGAQAPVGVGPGQNERMIGLGPEESLGHPAYGEVDPQELIQRLLAGQTGQ